MLPLGESIVCETVHMYILVIPSPPGQMTQRLPHIKLGDANANIQSLEECVREAPAPVWSRESDILALKVTQTYTDTYPRQGHTPDTNTTHLHVYQVQLQLIYILPILARDSLW